MDDRLIAKKALHCAVDCIFCSSYMCNLFLFFSDSDALKFSEHITSIEEMRHKDELIQVCYSV